MIARELRVLIKKEWRQLLRSRGAILTALFLPTLLLAIIPSIMLLGASSVPPGEMSRLPAGAG